MTDRPDVIQITCHDLGRRLGCYGAGVRSANLDALIGRGVRLTDAFAAAPQCSPSRAALATGRHPHANGVMGLAHRPFSWDLNPGERHIAQILSAAGYETHLFGHQHVSLDVHRLGFNHLHGIHDRHCDTADIVAERFRSWAHDRAASDDRAPRYVEINLDEPHRPYGGSCTDPEELARVSVPGYLPDHDAVRADLAAFQLALDAADAAVGRLVAALDEAGLWDHTVVVFTADHGLAAPRAKCTLYDPGLEIPLAFIAPGLAPGTRDGLVSNVDVLPTLLELAGVTSPTNLHGVSLANVLRGEAPHPREGIFAGKTYHSYYDPMRCVRTVRWKLIRNFESNFEFELPADVIESPMVQGAPAAFVPGVREASLELYDLAADPHEQTNLAARPTHARTREELEARLALWMRDTGDPLCDGPVPRPPGSADEPLRPLPV